MLKFTTLLIDPPDTEPLYSLTLPFELRQKSRQRAMLDDGSEVGLFLPRGTVLRDGDCLLAESGDIVRVRAAAENVSAVRTTNSRLLARACYHLGNRHVPVAIGDNWLAYLHDHVLDDMLRGLGLVVNKETAPFEPEIGAYHTHHHAHPHH